MKHFVSQNIAIDFSGKVYTFRHFGPKDTVPIKNAYVDLKTNDSSKTTQSDENGKYNFHLTTSSKTATLSIHTGKQTTSKDKYLCMFPSGNTFSTVNLASSKSVLTNFFLTPVPLCNCLPGLPTFYFGSNSELPAKAIVYDTILIESAIHNLFTLLSDFPKMKIEIIGNADKTEKNIELIALNRAQHIANRLISKGISKNQLVISSKNANFPVDKKVKSANRRVDTKILNFGQDMDLNFDSDD